MLFNFQNSTWCSNVVSEHYSTLNASGSIVGATSSNLPIRSSYRFIPDLPEQLNLKWIQCLPIGPNRIKNWRITFLVLVYWANKIFEESRKPICSTNASGILLHHNGGLLLEYIEDIMVDEIGPLINILIEILFSSNRSFTRGMEHLVAHLFYKLFC